MQWVNNGNNNKSAAEIDDLVHRIICHPHFSPEDLRTFKTQRENDCLNKHLNPDLQGEGKKDSGYHGLNCGETVFQQAGFRGADIMVKVSSGSKDVSSRLIPVPGLQYRKLVNVIKSAFTDAIAS